MKPDVTLHWSDDLARWRWRRAIYAYRHPETTELLYIGKNDGPTVRQRWSAQDKTEGLFRDLESERRIFEHIVLVADIRLPAGKRLTFELIADIEALLIHKLQPWGNIQSTKSRGITRPGLIVKNTGRVWPAARLLTDD